jgi:hypothetical protein
MRWPTSAHECLIIFPPTLIYGTQWRWDVVYPSGNHIDFERSLNSLCTLAPTIQPFLSPYSKLYEQVHGRNSAIYQLMLCESSFQILAGQVPFCCVLDDANLNLTRAQRELMLWHHRLGDASMRHIQTLLANPRDSLATQILVPKKASASTVLFLDVRRSSTPSKREIQLPLR